jgi:hypothetical protein
MRSLAFCLLGATFGFATAAHAQTPAASPTTEDARCLLAMVALTHSSDQNAQRLGQGGIVYFAGRLAGREPSFDFARLKTIAKTLDAKAVQADLQQRCGPAFNKTMQQLETALAPPAAPPSSSAPPPPPPGAH